MNFLPAAEGLNSSKGMLFPVKKKAPPPHGGRKERSRTEISKSKNLKGGLISIQNVSREGKNKGDQNRASQEESEGFPLGEERLFGSDLTRRETHSLPALGSGHLREKKREKLKTFAGRRKTFNSPPSRIFTSTQ